MLYIPTRVDGSARVNGSAFPALLVLIQPIYPATSAVHTGYSHCLSAIFGALMKTIYGNWNSNKPVIAAGSVQAVMLNGK